MYLSVTEIQKLLFMKFSLTNKLYEGCAYNLSLFNCFSGFKKI